MIVQCPDCTTRYQLDAERVPRQRVRVRCPKCRYVFPIDGSLADPAMLQSSGMTAPIAPTRPVPPVPEVPIVASNAPAPPVRSEDPIVQSPHVSTPVPAVKPEVQAEIPEPVQDPTPDPSEVAVSSADTATSEPQPSPPAEDPRAVDLEIERHASALSKSHSEVEVQTEADTAVATAAPPAPEPEAPADASTEDPTRKKAQRLARALVSDILVYNRELRDKSLAEGNLVQALGSEIKKSWELYKERVTPEVANSNNDFREALNEILADGQKIF